MVARQIITGECSTSRRYSVGDRTGIIARQYATGRAAKLGRAPLGRDDSVLRSGGRRPIWRRQQFVDVALAYRAERTCDEHANDVGTVHAQAGATHLLQTVVDAFHEVIRKSECELL